MMFIPHCKYFFLSSCTLNILVLSYVYSKQSILGLTQEWFRELSFSRLEKDIFHVQELEDELKENNMKWDVIGHGEVRRKEESFTTLQSGHLLYHSEANNGQAGVGFLINKKWRDNITRVSSGSSRVAELILLITDRYQLKIVQVYAPTTSHSDEETDNFYNTIDKILEKQTHYTIVMGDFNAKVGGQTNTSERDASAWVSEMKEETLL